MKVFIVTQKIISYDEYQLPERKDECLIGVYANKEKAIRKASGIVYPYTQRCPMTSLYKHNTWNTWIIHDLCSNKADSGYYRSIYVKITSVEID